MSTPAVSSKARRAGRLGGVFVCSLISGYLFHTDDLFPLVLSIGFALGALTLIERELTSY